MPNLLENRAVTALILAILAILVIPGDFSIAQDLSSAPEVGATTIVDTDRTDTRALEGLFVLEEADIGATDKVLQEQIPKNLRYRLRQLQGIKFPNGELFRTAVRLTTGLSPDSPTMNTILNVARKSGRPPSQEELQLAPIQWDGGDCGCGVFESLDQEYPSHLYGIYPYWQAPQAGYKSNDEEPETIDFSMLERIGYYGVTFNENGKIGQQLHFQKEHQSQDFSQFVKRAHQYKTKVDLIVYNSHWQSWLPEDGSDDPPAKGTDAIEKLIADLDSLLTEPLGGALNFIKPLISLGYSPSRTMGDGVTFDFDFRSLGDLQQQWLFDNVLGKKFFEQLQDSRLKEDGSSKNGVTYFTNIIVPVECMTTSEPELVRGCSYYSLENLQKIEPYVDLFLVDMSTAREDVLETMKLVLAHIDAPPVVGAEPVVEVARNILKKLVPLMGPHSDDANRKAKNIAASENVRYADWFFAGYGNWQLKSDSTTKEELLKWLIKSDNAEEAGGSAEAEGFEVIKKTVVTQLRRFEAKVCNMTCPKRWWLSTLIFLIVSVSTVYVIASFWLFRLRTLYRHVLAKRIFMPGVILTAAILFIVLWCDPYWSRYRSTIVSCAILGLLAFWLLAKRPPKKATIKRK